MTPAEVHAQLEAANARLDAMYESVPTLLSPEAVARRDERQRRRPEKRASLDRHRAGERLRRAADAIAAGPRLSGRAEKAVAEVRRVAGELTARPAPSLEGLDTSTRS
jgi:hypothetical protein